MSISQLVYTCREVNLEQRREIDNYIAQMDSDWSDFIVESIEEILRLNGFRDPDFSFSGFGFQGDGASFTGTWYPDDVDPNVSEYPDAPLIGKHFKDILNTDYNCSVRVSRLPYFSRYVHEKTMDIEVVPESEYEYNEELDVELLDVCMEFATWGYQLLKDHYDFITSDEEVLKALEDLKSDRVEKEENKDMEKEPKEIRDIEKTELLDTLRGMQDDLETMKNVLHGFEILVESCGNNTLRNVPLMTIVKTVEINHENYIVRQYNVQVKRMMQRLTNTFNYIYGEQND